MCGWCLCTLLPLASPILFHLFLNCGLSTFTLTPRTYSRAPFRRRQSALFPYAQFPCHSPSWRQTPQVLFSTDVTQACFILSQAQLRSPSNPDRRPAWPITCGCGHPPVWMESANQALPHLPCSAFLRSLKRLRSDQRFSPQPLLLTEAVLRLNL